MSALSDSYSLGDEGIELPIQTRQSPKEESFPALTPELRAELLDSERWADILRLYARTMKVAVALVDAQGQLVGSCHNPQPIWRRAREARPERGGDCVFCLDLDGPCTAVAEAFRTNSVVLAHDQGGFAHVAAPLWFADRHLGTLIAGQVFDRYPEPLPLERVARDFGLSTQDIWHLARQQPPISRAQLMVYGDLLRTLGEAFVRQRYSSVLERNLVETSQKFNAKLETLNVELSRKVDQLDSLNGDLRNLLHSTQIATIFLDRALRIRSFTPSIENVFPLASSDIGRPIADFARVLGEAGLAEPIDEVLRTLSIGSVQEFLLRPDLSSPGTQARYYLMRILPYRTIHHVIDGVVITFVNVTELKQAEQTAEHARVYAENIVATAREPLLVLDQDLRVKSANDAFYKTFQVSVDETEGQVLYELGNRQWDIPQLRRLLGDLLPREQAVANFQMQHNFTHLGPRTMVLNAQRIDHVDLILLAIEDVTDRKRAEDALKSLNRDLKNFTYAASHDLQEPLRMVVSYTQLLARQYKGKLDPQADQFIAYAVEGGQRMERLLKALREYWLMTERQLEQRTPIDCGRVIREAIATLHVSIRESVATVTYESMPIILAEEVSLAMLFQNLLGNAIKYSRPEETPHIHISAEKKGHMWCFSVRDNGIGIEAEHLEEIFSPFKRLHGAEYPGSGIGLTLCHKIVERYGGRLWVESTYGQGSTFRFTIPA